ncbi:MAG: hypothetical protein H7Z11_24260 [Verrucomicrobia bacterium]|nr:hypothetical protein [Leptolyngbya sp. ES-bin-22]
MNHLERCLKLESLSTDVCTPEPINPFRAGRSFLRQHWQHLMNTLARVNELHVWRRIDRVGTLYWQAYDPTTGRSTTGSEGDVRAWIEQLHYSK